MISRLDLPNFDHPLVLSGYTANLRKLGQGPPVVLVPGLAGGIDLLDPLIERLARHFTVYAYELRGEREGLFDRGYDLRSLASDLREVLDTLRLETPTVLGVSFGGAIALELATHHPGRIGRLVVQGAASAHQKGLFTSVLTTMLGRMRLPGDNPFLNQFFRVLTAGQRPDPEQIARLAEQCWRTDQGVMAHRFALLEDYDVEYRLAETHTPTLVLGGERDWLVEPARMRRVANSMPEAEYRPVPGGGHFSFVTHADFIAEAIRDFQRGERATVG